MSAKPLNVVLFVSDTFRRDNLTVHGGTEIHTPYLDRFAQMAQVFERAYCGSFPTVPARTDLFTGKWTFPHRDWSRLPREETVLAELLSHAGYTTMMIVDTPHLLNYGYHFDRGFTAFEWIRGQENDRWRTDPIEVEYSFDIRKCRLGERTLRQYLRNVADRRSEEDYFPARTVNAAMRWLERNATQKPFFLYIDTFDPHEPWDPPRHYTDLYDPNYEGEEVIYPHYWYWREFMTEAELNHCRALYRGEVTMVDYWFGRLIARLESLNLLEDTVVIFTADHGFYFGEHGIIGKALFEERDGKHIFHRSPIYDEVARIPLLIYVPHAKPAYHEAFTGFVDLMPTILELAGVEIPSEVQGRSLLPLIRGEPVAWRDFFVTSWAIVHQPGETLSRAVDGTERVVLSPRPSTIHEREWTLLYSVAGDEVELYHTATDPAQAHNVAQRYPDVARNLHAKFLRFLEQCGTREEYLQPRREISV
jgi:arylsulfatase A-like enzyme